MCRLYIGFLKVMCYKLSLNWYKFDEYWPVLSEVIDYHCYSNESEEYIMLFISEHMMTLLPICTINDIQIACQY